VFCVINLDKIQKLDDKVTEMIENVKILKVDFNMP